MTDPWRAALVTGGAGFLGSELVLQLVAQGERVVVVDNLVNGSASNLAGLPRDSFELVVADIRDVDRMAELMRGVDVCFHLACLGVRHSIYAPQENHDVNATATLGLLQAAMRAGVQRFVYQSSSEVYGTAASTPITEDHPPWPRTVYGASKLAGECYARAFHLTHGYPTVIVRAFNVYGPRSHHEGDAGEVIPRFLLRCLAGRPLIVFGDGSQTRDFTFVSDSAEGILLAARSPHAVGDTINIGSGREVSIREVAELTAAVVGRDDVELIYDEPRPGDARRLCAGIERARTLLGFNPRVGLHEGLERLLEWYRSRGVGVDVLLEQEVVHNWRPPGDES